MNGTIARIDDSPATLGARFAHGGTRVWHLVSGPERMRCAVKPIGRGNGADLDGLKKNIVTGISTHSARFSIIVWVFRSRIPNVSLRFDSIECNAGPDPGKQQGKKKATGWPLSIFEDAGGSSALSLLRFLLFLRFPFGPRRPIQTLKTLSVGLPGASRLSLFFRVQPVRFACFHRGFSPASSANSSAVRIHRPQHLLRLESLPAGRVSTSELVGAWAKGPI